ncbi:MAG: DNA translocase FtsK [Bacilli bacterium]
MAKRKKTKDSDTKSFKYSIEMTGLLLVLIGVIGTGFGIVGSFIKKFAMFLVGEWWPIILLLLIYLGLVMMFKRKLPNFFSGKMIGFYILFIVVLTLSHYTYMKVNAGSAIVKATMDTYESRIATVSPNAGLMASGQVDYAIGGGIIGAVVSMGFSTLFGLVGTIIVLVIMGLFGVILLFDITLSDVLDAVKRFFSSLKNKDEEDDDDEDNTEEIKDDRVIITSVEELKNKEESAPIITNSNIVDNEIVTQNYSEQVRHSTHEYRLPSLDILDNPALPKKENSNTFVTEKKNSLERVLNDFQIKGRVVEIHVGPAVTQYEVQIPNGTKVSRIVNINKEIALALAAKDVRIQAPIPGKSTIGIEIPNPVISSVRIKEVVANVPKTQEGAKILVSLGKDIMGRVQTADISKMPHLLVAGSTGSGKSVCINSFIATILLKYRPDEVKLVMVDPKKVELSNYNGIPHLLCPVITDAKQANLALQKIVVEMERRYEVFSDEGVKNISGYNEKIEKKNRSSNVKIPKMPYMVVIIDELADLMLVAAKEVEDSIMRITQMARAAGIHLIVATQRPSTDVITGVVKANIPSRIAFAVATSIDSRTILDMGGAEKLLGKGDMLYLPMGENAPIRIQGCFISDDEIRRLIEYVSKEESAEYDETILQASSNDHNPVSGDKETFDDPMYDEIVKYVISTGKASASLLQRRFRLGYNRAARIIDLLEERGIIGPQNGSKPREVLVKLEAQEEKE